MPHLDPPQNPSPQRSGPDTRTYIHHTNTTHTQRCGPDTHTHTSHRTHTSHTFIRTHTHARARAQVASGKSPKWNVDRLEVTSVSTGRTFTFEHDDWVTPESAVSLKVTLPAAEYQLTVVTGEGEGVVYIACCIVVYVCILYTSVYRRGRRCVVCCIEIQSGVCACG